jgi:hypothetical protein
MTAAIDHLHATQPHIVADDRALAGVAPVTHAHINSLGRYELNRQPPPLGQLRPLRLTGETDRAVPTPPLGVSGDKH